MSHNPPGDYYELYTDWCHLLDEVCWWSSNIKKIQHLKLLYVIWRGKSAVFTHMLDFHKLIEKRERAVFLNFCFLAFPFSVILSGLWLACLPVILLLTPTKCWRLWWHRSNFSSFKLFCNCFESLKPSVYSVELQAPYFMHSAFFQSLLNFSRHFE